jgi:hypothetical protein
MQGYSVSASFYDGVPGSHFQADTFSPTLRQVDTGEAILQACLKQCPSSETIHPAEYRAG